MKKIILKFISLLFLITIFLSCDNKNRIDNMDFQIKVIDSCEYLISKSPAGDYGWVMSHKGNCKYCIKRFKNANN